SSTVLSYELGAPGNSDLIAVSGNLTLDGTVNLSDAGGFTNGLYTLLTYAGVLTDSGLLVGTTPNGSLVYTILTGSGLVKLDVGCTAPAGPITGSSSVPSGQSGVSYSISSVSGATTYNWTAPSGASIASGQGTTSVTVNYTCSASSGNVTV